MSSVVWDMGLRVWFVVAILSLVAAYVLAGKASVLPGPWRAINVALIGLVGMAVAIGLGAKGGIMASLALLVVVLVESIGLWLGMVRWKAGAGGILAFAGTLCVLFASIRILTGAVRAATTSESMGLAELLTEGIVQPLLIFLGAVALGIGGRISSVRARRLNRARA